MSVLGWLALVLAALPAFLCVANLRSLRPLRSTPLPDGTLVSVLIPARNEAANIGAALEAARASVGIAVEIIVMDDGSTDGTGEIVAAHAALDPRVRLAEAAALPPGWAGKPHACRQLAGIARGTHLLFVDADVRLGAHTAARLAAHALHDQRALVSAVPRQLMPTLGELLTVPLVNFLLYGYLPIGRMRSSPVPSLAAGCGQLLMVDRDTYLRTGGHALVRASLHDGLQLARAFRKLGLRTDLVAGAGLAECRMYHGLREAWGGFAKNACEGMATPRLLPLWTLLLGGGHVLPPFLVVAALAGLGPLWPALGALILSLGIRLAVSLAVGESLLAVPLHPATVAVGLAIQWTALVRSWVGRPSTWKGRSYGARKAS